MVWVGSAYDKTAGVYLKDADLFNDRPQYTGVTAAPGGTEHDSPQGTPASYKTDPPTPEQHRQ